MEARINEEAERATHYLDETTEPRIVEVDISFWIAYWHIHQKHIYETTGPRIVEVIIPLENIEYWHIKYWMRRLSPGLLMWIFLLQAYWHIYIPTSRIVGVNISFEKNIHTFTSRFEGGWGGADQASHEDHRGDGGVWGCAHVEEQQDGRSGLHVQALWKVGVEQDLAIFLVFYIDIHCSQKGPYFRDRVPIGTFLTFWVPIGSLFSLFLAKFTQRMSIQSAYMQQWVNLICAV